VFVSVVMNFLDLMVERIVYVKNVSRKTLTNPGKKKKMDLGDY
jgi:hypothetical protein